MFLSSKTMAEKSKQRSQSSPGKWTLRARRLVFWIPLTSLLAGAALSATIYIYLKQREIETQKTASYQKAHEVLNQIDLELSNSLLRIQTYEDSLGQIPIEKLNRPNYIAQALSYTIFERLSVVRDTNPKNNPNRRINYAIVNRFTRPDSRLTTSMSKYIQSSEIIQGAQALKESASYIKTLLHESDQLPRISMIMRSKSYRDVFFVFTAPLISLFEKVELSNTDSIIVRDLDLNAAWKITGNRKNKKIESIGSSQESVTEPSFQFVFERGLAKSGVPLSLQFNYTQKDNTFLSISNMSGFFGAIITLIVSYLFYLLITLNRTANRMIINKTLDLEKTTHDLQEALNGKNKFLGKISHEIRTPLNLILGMIDLCTENNNDSSIRPYLRSMKSSGEHLLSMIDDLLDLAKAESNDLNFQGRKTFLVSFLSEVAKLCAQDYEAKGLKFYTNFASNLPLVVTCDPNRLRQVLLNLLRNAYKYTHHGYICFNASLLPSSNDAFAKIRFEVQDTGIGIPSDKLNKVFEAFFQMESTSAFSEGGVGLGLSIVKDIVQKMDGRIHVESSSQAGSIFQVDLDLEIFDKTPWIESYRDTEAKLKQVIILSRDPMLQNSLEPLLQHPLLTLHFPDPLESEFFIKNLPSNEQTFVIWDQETFDFSMESAIKKWPTKFLILIDHGKTTINNSLIPHTIASLTKTPVLASELLSHLGLSQRQSLKKEVKAPETIELKTVYVLPPKENLKILVADDDLGNIELYKAYFSKTTWNVQYTLNGLEAWEAYQKQELDLLILDVRMPIMDGFAVIEKIREKEAGSPGIPIIVVTADLLDYTTDRAKQFPNVSLLTKPLKKALLFEQIQKSV